MRSAIPARVGALVAATSVALGVIVVLGVVIAFGVGLGACQTSDVSRELGARCDDAAECDDRCLMAGSDYPGGFCTTACDGRDDCEAGATCAELDGGVCLFECAGNDGCLFLGTGWRCVAADLRGGSASKVMVCRGR
jgi:hypothetical protein